MTSRLLSRARWACVVFLLAVSVSPALAQESTAQDQLQKATFDASALARVEWDGERGVPQFLAGDLGAYGAAPEAARSFLTANAAAFGFDADPEVRLVRAERDELGLEHVFVRQEVGGVPVWGAESALHLDASGRAYAWGGTLHPGAARVSTRPALGAATALDAARAAVGATEERASIPADGIAEAVDWTPQTNLVVYPGEDGYALAYHVRVFVDRPEPANWEVFVDAQTGAVLDRFNSLHTADPRAPHPAPLGAPLGGGVAEALASPVFADSPAIGSGKSLYDGTVSIPTQFHDGTYRLYDTTRGPAYLRTLSAGGQPVTPGSDVTDSDNKFTKKSQQAAVSAHAAVVKVFDYYKDTHGRSGYDNANANVTSIVNFTVWPDGAGWNNAIWNGAYMIFGDGDGDLFSPLVDLDIVAHEYTHAVTNATAGLIYRDESGALNEAVSDIMAMMVDRDDFYIGEDSFTPGTSGDALRYLDDPSRDDQPDHYDDRYRGSGDNGGVHYNSGIAAKQAYLMIAGGTFHGQTVRAVGRSVTEKVWYRALTRYFTRSSTFAQARQGLLQAAADLYGEGSKEYDAVANAWAAVGVGKPSEDGGDGGDDDSGFKGAFPDQGTWYHIENLATGERLDTDGDDRPVDTDPGTAEDKQWRFISANDGPYWFLENRRTGERLDTDGCKSVDVDNGTADDKRWKLVEAGGGRYHIENKKCAPARLDADGTDRPVDVDPGTADDKQWSFIEAGSVQGVVGTETTFAGAPVEAVLAFAEAGSVELALRVYPNPARAQATLALSLPEAGAARVVVFDLLGREVAEAFDGPLPAGERQVAFDTSRLPAGVYVVVADVAGQRLTQRITVVR